MTSRCASASILPLLTGHRALTNRNSNGQQTHAYQNQIPRNQIPAFNPWHQPGQSEYNCNALQLSLRQVVRDPD